MIHHTTFKFREKLTQRTETKYIILHHTKVTGRHNVQEIHQWHLNRKTKSGEPWAGIGYHYYVDKDGEIFTGRPIDTKGSHVFVEGQSYNSVSVGVCFEGDFDIEKMSEKQLENSVLLISILSLVYGDAAIRGHRNFKRKETCPGNNFPMKELLERVKVQKKRFIRLYGDPKEVDYSFLLKYLE